ncbi:MFS transporter [Streptomyces aquilus]|uniref:MFS transporter n=1 Tax=Streptomyces aquilus TaxID=2548456 RepID=UPI001FCC61D7|nr:MFS transporter [Streptomyces aquilus]
MSRIRTRVRPDAEASAATDSAAHRYENRLLLILFLAFGFVFFDRQALPFLAPYIAEDFHLSNTELGTLSGVLALTWALSGLVAGRLSDKLGRRKPILIAAVVLFSCFSAAGGLMTGFLGLLVARALMGMAEGAVLPLAQSLMVEASRDSRRGLNMGLLQGSSAGLMGGILAPPGGGVDRRAPRLAHCPAPDDRARSAHRGLDREVGQGSTARRPGPARRRGHP